MSDAHPKCDNRSSHLLDNDVLRLATPTTLESTHRLIATNG